MNERNMYLVPANAKKSMLYFGVFNMADIILFGSGVVLTFILLLTLPIEKLIFALIAITPGCICGFLVIPVPNYHNIRTIIKSAYDFYTTRQRFVWKGWCLRDGEQDKK